MATITCGYADGYLRSFKNFGFIIVNGQKAPIIGSICMDQFMVDITNIENVHTGDEVILIGTENNIYISFDKIAGNIGTIGYELISIINRRVPRVYFRNNTPVKHINYLLNS